MKTQLTAEQSAKLIELGVSPERVSESKSSVAYGNGARGIMKVPEMPIFTLTDILDILPKEIEVDSPNADGGIDTEDCYLCTQWCMNGDYADNHQWCAFYTPGFQLSDRRLYRPRTHRRSPLDACVVSGERVCEIRRKRK